MFWQKTRLPVLVNPKLALFNLVPEKAAALAALDAKWLSRMFESAVVSGTIVPRCDVLFLYADITANGVVVGSLLGLREIIRDSGAKIVVVASENPSESYIKAGVQGAYGRANLVMTLNRRGAAFERFFFALFSKMRNGVSMPVAWVQLNPQECGPNYEAPDTIFACELGPLTFS